MATVTTIENSIKEMGGQPLEGSGFESEAPEQNVSEPILLDKEGIA